MQHCKQKQQASKPMSQEAHAATGLLAGMQHCHSHTCPVSLQQHQAPQRCYVSVMQHACEYLWWEYVLLRRGSAAVDSGMALTRPGLHLEESSEEVLHISQWAHEQHVMVCALGCCCVLQR